MSRSKVIFALVALATLVPSVAHTDVISTNNEVRASVRFIRDGIAPDGESLFRVDYCDSNGSCDRLGSRPYSKGELEKLGNRAMYKAVGVGAGEAIAVASAVVAAVYLGGATWVAINAIPALGSGAGGGGGVFLASGATTIGTSYGAIKGISDLLNPAPNYRLAQALNDPVLNGKTIRIGGSMADFARRLSVALSSLQKSSESVEESAIAEDNEKTLASFVAEPIDAQQISRAKDLQ